MAYNEQINSTWESAKLSDIFVFVGGGTPDKKQSSYWNGNIPWASVKDIKHKNLRATEDFITKEGLDHSAANLAEKDDVILITRISPGETTIARVESAVNQDLKIVKYFGGMRPEFLYYLFNAIRQEFIKRASGTTVKGIKLSDLDDIQIAIPPLNEQHRIVEKIEELFSELDNGIANLQLAQQQLKVYRQSLLKAAFEGKLTEEWRKENNPEPAEKLLERIKAERQERYEREIEEWKATVKEWENGGKDGKRPSKPRKSSVPDLPNESHESKKWALPNDWSWTQLGLVSFITKLAGFEYTKHVNYDDDGDLAVIKAENAGPYGFKKTDYSRIKSDTISHLTRSQLSGGELLIVFVGAGTGNVAVVPRNNIFFLGPNIGMARPEIGVNSKFLQYFYQSPHGKEIMMVTAKAVAQPSLSMGTIRQSPLALPSAEEQLEIVQILDSTISVIENIEYSVELNIRKAEVLRQSILKMAFEGKLVAQNPKDEPASVLLERIKEEKSKYLAEQKQRKKRAPKKIRKMNKNLSIEDVLKAAQKPMPAKEVWQQSKHKDDIEAFYAALKKIQDQVKEVKKGTKSLLSLAE